MMLKLLCILSLAIVLRTEIVQILSLNRHGARYALNSLYDGNNTKNDWGELTAVGMRQHYTYGQNLRKLYVDDAKLLFPSYNHSQIEAYSTKYNRTIMSLVSQFQGMYPEGTGTQLPNLDQKLLVPPYKYNDDVNERKFALPLGRQLLQFNENKNFFIDCGNQIPINEQYYNTTFQEMNIRYQPFIDSMRAQFKVTNPLTVINMSSLYDTITTDLWNGLSVNISQGDLTNMRHLHDFSNLLKLSANFSKALNTPKLQLLFDRFDKRISTPSSKLKWTILSAHDTDILPMQVGLNISSSSCIQQLYRYNKTNALNCYPGPDYASSVIFELHKIVSDYFIMVRYNGQYVYLCERKDTKCPYAQFKSRVTSTFVDYKKVCNIANQMIV